MALLELPCCPRTEAFLKHIVGTMISAYNTVMVDYTKNTGGDDAAITIQQQREEADILNYHKKIKNSVYLTVVRMFNNMYSVPLIVAKDGVPIEFQIDDSRTEMVSPISTRQAKQYLPVDDGNQQNEEMASRAK